MKLTHKDYKKPTLSKKVVVDVKQKIKDFVGKGSVDYEKIIKHIQKTDNMTNDEVYKQIKEVAEESDYKPVVEEEVIDVPII